MREKAPRLVSAHHQHYITFLRSVPSIGFGAMKVTLTVTERDPAKIANFPDHCYAFYFFDLITAVIDSEGEAHELAKEIKQSGRYYITGKVHTLADVEERTANGELDKKFPLRHMQEKGLEAMIQVGQEDWQPFTKNDVLLPPKAH